MKRNSNPQTTDMKDVLAYYELGGEQVRLTRSSGIIEFERTKAILLQHLPHPPAVVADIGGGPGRYAAWLADLGFHVLHRDVVPLHVQQTRDLAATHPDWRIDTAEGDATQLDIETDSVDAVLLLGPLYHLPDRARRIQALRECGRIGKAGAPVFIAAISRWAARIDAILLHKVYEEAPDTLTALPEWERTGWIKPRSPGSFTAYTHRPAQLRAEIRSARLDVVSLVGVESVSFLLDDLEPRLRDPLAFQVLMQSLRTLEAVPEVLGVSPHVLATAAIPLPKPHGG